MIFQSKRFLTLSRRLKQMNSKLSSLSTSTAKPKSKTSLPLTKVPQHLWSTCTFSVCKEAVLPTRTRPLRHTNLISSAQMAKFQIWKLSMKHLEMQAQASPLTLSKTTPLLLRLVLPCWFHLYPSIMKLVSTSTAMLSWLSNPALKPQITSLLQKCTFEWRTIHIAY